MMGIARGIVAAILFVAFLAMIVWVASKHNRQRFEAAARLPLEEDNGPLVPKLSHAKTAANHAEQQ